MGKAQDRGYHGEQTAGFILGRRGYMFVDGPSGSGGHRANAPGFDGVAYNPKTDHLIIYDNKAFGQPKNVSSASALTRTFRNNLSRLIKHIDTLQDLPFKNLIRKRLNSAQTAFLNNQKIPKEVEIVVTNAGGNVKGITERLGKMGIRFMNLNTNQKNNKTGTPAMPRPTTGGRVPTVGRGHVVKPPVRSGIGVAPKPIRLPSPVARMQIRGVRIGGFAQLFTMGMMKLNSMALRHRIEKELNSQNTRDAIARGLLDGFGVLIIIRYELRKHDVGTTSVFLGLHTHTGKSQESAIKKWEGMPKVLQDASSRFNRVVTNYQWIPTLEEQSRRRATNR